MTMRHALSFLVIAVVQFGIFEAGLRTWGSSEAAPSFQGLFDTDRDDRLPAQAARPNALHDQRVHRRDRDQRGRPPRRRRDRTEAAERNGAIVLLGDSLVLSVQVPFAQTFGELLEQRLNRRSIAVSLPRHQRRRARLRADRGTALLSLHCRHGAGGPGPAGRLRRQRRRGSGRLAATSSTTPGATSAGRRRLAHDPAAAPRQAQHGAADPPPARHLRDRTTRRRSLAPPEPPLQSYAAQPAPRIADGLALTRAVDDRHRADRGDRRRGHGVRPDAGALSGRRRGLWPAAGCGVDGRRDAGARRRQRALRRAP